MNPELKKSLEEIAIRIEHVRTSALFDDLPAALTGETEQYFLLAIANLEQAQRFMMLAEIKVTV